MYDSVSGWIMLLVIGMCFFIRFISAVAEAEEKIELEYEREAEKGSNSWRRWDE